MRNRVITLALVLAFLPFAALAMPVLWAGAIPANQAGEEFFREVTLASATVVTADAQSATFDGWAAADLIAVTINCTEDSGTATLDIALQRSISGGTVWTSTVAMTQLSATGSETKTYSDVEASSAQAIGDSLRVNFDVTGTGQYTCTVWLYGEG